MNTTQIVIHVLKEMPPLTLIPAEILPEAEEDIYYFLKRNRLIPLFHEKVKHLPGLFSAAFTERLKDASRHEMMRMMRMEGVFIKMIRLFAEKGITVVHIKGFSLASKVYEKTFHRPMSDIDLLVHPKDFESASEELIKAGAKTEESFAVESAEGINFDKTFVVDGVQVELHHHLMNPVFKNTPDRTLIFGNTETTLISGMKILVLRPEMELFYLLHHLNRHWDYKLARFIWMEDIHLFLHHYSGRIHWQQFLRIADEAGRSRDIFRGLYVCNELFGDELPEGIPACKNPATLTLKYLSMCREDRSRLFVGSFKMLGQIKGWRHKIRFVKEKLKQRARSCKR